MRADRLNAGESPIVYLVSVEASAKCKNHSWSTMVGYGHPGPPDPP